MTRLLTAAALAAFAAPAFAGDLKSGPQPGQKVPGPFAPLNVNGEDAGKKSCQYCKNGDNPVAVVFARCAECPQTVKLIKRIDEVTKQHSGCEMGSYVVFCSSDDNLPEQLQQLAKDLQKTVLTIDTPAGPSKYDINKDADLTVVLYDNRTVKANFAFEKGKITDSDIDAVVADVSKIVPAK